MKSFLTVVLLTFFTISGKSQQLSDLKLEGTWTYNVDMTKDTIRISGGSIKNNNTDAHSGAIKMIIFLSATEYSLDDNPTGFELAEYVFYPLGSGEEYSYVDKTLPFYFKPPDGDYYAAIVILEQQGTDYIVRDYLNFNGMMTVKYSPNNDTDDEDDEYDDLFDDLY
jgi:hypothetical protein